ncbi:MAG: DUF1499 domain-containing protein [Promethearchaeota archaeon]|nr:MAG: DUF1499 domain-containing protein [Candidatus Lokiarchaeota archaeon]
MPKEPRNVGLVEGKFNPCPETNTCVSTMSPPTDEKHYMEPIDFESSMEEVKEKILSVINSFKRSEIIKESENYIHASFTTFLFRWTDDAEFLIDNENKVIHFKSQTRLNGYYDWGKNRSRMKKFKKKFKARK